MYLLMMYWDGTNKRRTMITDQYLISRNHRQHEDDRGSLELFKNLLQPHFLFNSLNNLYALSLRKSEDTPEAIAGLSQLLERVVSYSRQEMIPLSEEIALIQEYISLEKIWLGESSFLMDFQVKGDTEGVSIPPLTIYTLIENAFKHGIRKCHNNGWVTILLVVKEDKILGVFITPGITVLLYRHIQGSVIPIIKWIGAGQSPVCECIREGTKKILFGNSRIVIVGS